MQQTTLASLWEQLRRKHVAVAHKHTHNQALNAQTETEYTTETQLAQSAHAQTHTCKHVNTQAQINTTRVDKVNKTNNTHVGGVFRKSAD